MASKFILNEDYRLLICKQCESSLPPTRSGQTRHLRLRCHGYKGPQLRALLERFDQYGPLRSTKEPMDILPGRLPPLAIPHLRVDTVFACLKCEKQPFSKNQSNIQQHISSAHKLPLKKQEENTDWRRLRGQSLYRENKDLVYFEVREVETSEAGANHAEDDSVAASASRVKEFVDGIIASQAAEAEVRKEKTVLIEGFGAHRSEAVPWLEKIGISGYLCNLPSDQVYASYSKPLENAWIQPVLEHTARYLRASYQSIRDDNPESIITFSIKTAMISQVGGHKTQAYRTNKMEKTLEDYIRIWQGLLIFVDRMMSLKSESDRAKFWFPDGVIPKGAKMPDPPISKKLLDQYECVKRLAQFGTDESDMDIELLMYFDCLLSYKTGMRDTDSLLCGYTALLAFKPNTLTWKVAGAFSSNMSALIYIGQLVEFCRAYLDHIDHVRTCYQYDSDEIEALPVSEQPSLLRQVRERFDKVARPSSETAFGTLLNWRSYVLGVNKTEMPINEAIWDQDRLKLTYADTSLKLDDVPKLVVSEFRAAQRILYTELMLSPREVKSVSLYQVKDSLSHVVAGESIIDLNPEIVPRNHLANILAKNKSLQAMYFDQTRSVSGRASQLVYSKKAIESYEVSVEAFLKHLMVLIHISSGQPLRGPELMSVKWANTQNSRRSIFVLDGMVMIRVSYHKTQSTVSQSKDNVRFLPGPVGQLLVDFIIHVQPLRQHFLAYLDPSLRLSQFLWAKDGKPWFEKVVSAQLAKACMTAEMPKLSVQVWRQMTVAIVKAKFSKDKDCFHIPGGDGPNDDAGSDGDSDEEQAIMASQRNHSLGTSNLAYANEFSTAGMADRKIQQGRKASQLWCDLFQFVPLLSAASKRFREVDEEVDDGGAIGAGLKASKKARVEKYSSKQLLDAVRGLLDNPRAKWKSSHQEHCLKVVMQPANTVVAVLPTGGGKSLLFMVPCKLQDRLVTVVVVPLVSLRVDLERRMQQAKISVSMWNKDLRAESRVVLVSAEEATSRPFKAFCQRLLAYQRLDRIVIDECHLTVTARDYRQSMIRLPQLRELEVCFLYLTATLPPSLEEQFRVINHLGSSASILRCSVDRPGIEYSIKWANDTDLARVGGRLVLAFLDKMSSQNNKSTGYRWKAEDRCIVFCQTIAVAEEAAQALGCPVFHSKCGSTEEKAEILARWLSPENTGSPCIATTSALSAGFDYAHVRATFHFDAPNSLIDFAQESGRIGRDGKPGTATVILANNRRKFDDQVEKLFDIRYCMRSTLSEYLDGPKLQASSCMEQLQEGVDVMECWQCQKMTQQEASLQLSSEGPGEPYYSDNNFEAEDIPFSPGPSSPIPIEIPSSPPPPVAPAAPKPRNPLPSQPIHRQERPASSIPNDDISSSLPRTLPELWSATGRPQAAAQSRGSRANGSRATAQAGEASSIPSISTPIQNRATTGSTSGIRSRVRRDGSLHTPPVSAQRPKFVNASAKRKPADVEAQTPPLKATRFARSHATGSSRAATSTPVQQATGSSGKVKQVPTPELSSQQAPGRSRKRVMEAGSGKKQSLPLSTRDEIEDSDTGEPAVTGGQQYRITERVHEEMLSSLRTNLQLLQGTCSFCRVTGPKPDHVFQKCRLFNPYLLHKKRLASSKQWFKPNIVCFRCCVPSQICSAAVDKSAEECQFKDLLMPYALSVVMNQREWVLERWSMLEELDNFDEDIYHILKELGSSVLVGAKSTILAAKLVTRYWAEFPMV